MTSIPVSWPEKIPVVAGVRMSATSAGIKKNGAVDLVYFDIESNSRISGVFTKNAFCAAPVNICREHLKAYDRSKSIGLLINSGNANACTGKAGFDNAKATCVSAAELAQHSFDKNIFPFSTGVIGEDLPGEKITAALPTLFDSLSECKWGDAARGIMTTDTVPKLSYRVLDVNGTAVNIVGISKGSGMIQPNMATMLGYIFTDAEIEQTLLNELCREAADQSFNSITVDSDTSTNDSCMLVATGKSGQHIRDDNSPDYRDFVNALNEVFADLAKAIVIDGEGATKFITVDVTHGASVEECRTVAFSVANSPLVKTALFASDPNWGRIVMAIGKSGITDLNADSVQVWLNDVNIVENGGRALTYTEEQGAEALAQAEVTIKISLNRGNESAKVWTSDLSHEYVTINAEYRT